MLDVEVIAEQYTDSVVEVARERSKLMLGELSEAFVIGYMQRDMQALLWDLELSQEQLEILSTYVM